MWNSNTVTIYTVIEDEVTGSWRAIYARRIECLGYATFRNELIEPPRRSAMNPWVDDGGRMVWTLVGADCDLFVLYGV